MIILDSSIIIAMFRNNEKHHGDAVAIWKSGSDFLLFDYVLSEVLTVLKIREGHDVADRCADFLTNNLKIFIEQIDEIQLSKAVSFFRDVKNNLSFVDTVLLLQSKERAVPLATFDRELAKYINKNNGDDR
ncbi:hypothetical protein CVV38_01190 [Candidatus Peregrinibacteria bacterium HGW-Peregrinibacteria-1]|jgi:predicted nucleic acid-binding protein|nr:MAG: hypothetical protein CVV38_01190 [Candidatus Peregrinibacteria bacterium HGW-Peregrinibacteria-1]